MGQTLGGARMFPLAVTPETIARKNREAIRGAEKEKRRALVAHHSRKRQANKLQRTPRWADLGAIHAFYVEAARLTADTGVQHHVDHALPLQGRLVSGLHVETNLQILTGRENSRKKNRFEP